MVFELFNVIWINTDLNQYLLEKCNYRPVDVVAWGKMMSWDLVNDFYDWQKDEILNYQTVFSKKKKSNEKSNNFDQEVLRFEMENHLGILPSRVDQFMPDYPLDRFPTIIKDGEMSEIDELAVYVDELRANKSRNATSVEMNEEEEETARKRESPNNIELLRKFVSR